MCIRDSHNVIIPILLYPMKTEIYFLFEWTLFYNKLMKLPNNLGLKAYLILFGIISLGNFLSLTTSDGSAYIYYNTIIVRERNYLVHIRVTSYHWIQMDLAYNSVTQVY